MNDLIVTCGDCNGKGCGACNGKGVIVITGGRATTNGGRHRV